MHPGAPRVPEPPLADEDWVDERRTDPDRTDVHPAQEVLAPPLSHTGFSRIGPLAAPTVPEPVVPQPVVSEPTLPVATAAPPPPAPAALALPRMASPLSSTAPPASGDLIPPSGTPRESVRRDRQRRRLRALALGAGAVLVVGLVVLTWRGGGGADPVTEGAADPSRARTAGSPDRPRRSSTTKPGSSSTSTTSTTTSTPVGAVAPTAPGPGEDSLEPDPVEPSDPLAALSVTENPGACRWDASAQELSDSGRAHNNGSVDVDVEIEVTWVDATGELEYWSDFATLAPGETYDWELFAPWLDPPQGLRCVIALF